MTSVIYEIVNPSDAYQCEAADNEIATVVGVFLGGRYPLSRAETNWQSPFLMLMDEAATEQWFQQHFGASMETVLANVVDNRRAELIAALESVMIRLVEFREFRAARRNMNELDASLNGEDARVLDDEALVEKWHDSNRTSLNDIRAHALDCVAQLRKQSS